MEADFIENEEFHEYFLSLSYTQLSQNVPVELDSTFITDYSKKVKNAFYNRLKLELSLIKVKSHTD